MFPIIDVFGRQIGTYAIMAIVGALLVGFLFCRRISTLGLDDNTAIVFLLICSVGVLVGGSLLYGITNIHYLSLLGSAKNFSDVFNTFKLVFGGSVFYGGLLGAILAGYIYIKVKKLDIVIYTDNIAPFIPLFHSIARVGCFLGGCCYGIESPIGFTAHNNPLVPQVNDVSRFPVQLLEAALNFILFLILLKLLQSGKFKGKMLLIYLISYSVIRFFDEFLRGDKIRGFILSLSTSQFISVIIFIVVGAILIFTAKKEKQHK